MVANLTSADVTLETAGRDCSFKDLVENMYCAEIYTFRVSKTLFFIFCTWFYVSMRKFISLNILLCLFKLTITNRLYIHEFDLLMSGL